MFSEIAIGWPLRSVIMARWPGKVASIGPCGALATISATGLSTRCGASGVTIVARASFASTAANNAQKPPVAMTRRERVRSMAARLARSGAVTRTFSIRGTASDRLAPTRGIGRPNRPACDGAGPGGGTGSVGSVIETNSIGIVRLRGVDRGRTWQRR